MPQNSLIGANGNSKIIKNKKVTAMKTDYFQLIPFTNVYLEDSYVLGIEERENELLFELELVLLEGHPYYSEPAKDKQYCYRRAQLSFLGVKKVQWLRKDLHQITGIDEEVDYGNIDQMWFENGVYFVEGEWGKLEIVADKIDLQFLEEIS